MPQSERFEVLPLVGTYSQLINSLIPITDSDHAPKLLPEDAVLGGENEKFAKRFIDEMKAITILTTGIHWRWAQILFYFDVGRLWETKAAGKYTSFNDWLNDALEWLPFGRAQANKLKRLWLIYVHYLRCNEDPELLGFLLQIGNVDKLAEISANVNKQNIRAWLEYLVTEDPTLIEVHAIAQEAKRMMIDEDYERSDLLPETIVTEPVPLPDKNEETFKSLKSSGIGRSWFGKIPPDAPVRIKRISTEDKTIITIYRQD